MDYDAEIWGPHYWFFLNTVAMIYPDQPNAIVKKKYYSLFQNLPLFIPNSKISNSFNDMLNLYPVNNYLNSKNSLLKWIHFIHNKINVKLNKKPITYLEFIDNYNNIYVKKEDGIVEKMKNNKKFIVSLIFIIILFMIYLYY